MRYRHFENSISSSAILYMKSLFQASNGLTVDGICGAKTWAALGVTDTQETGAAERLTALEERVRALEDAITAMRSRLEAPEEGA